MSQCQFQLDVIGIFKASWEGRSSRNRLQVVLEKKTHAANRNTAKISKKSQQEGPTILATKGPEPLGRVMGVVGKSLPDGLQSDRLKEVAAHLEGRGQGCHRGNVPVQSLIELCCVTERPIERGDL